MLSFNANASSARKYGTTVWEPMNLLGGGCNVCKEAFGFMQMRHHCRRCGFVVCMSCLYPERLSVGGSKHPKPVCRPCAKNPVETRSSLKARKEEQEEATKSLFSLLDIDNDGFITRDEWLKAFDLIDVNHDGAIHRKEWFTHQGTSYFFDSIKRKNKAQITRKEWSAAYDVVDTDHDGKIDLAEWGNAERDSTSFVSSTCTDPMSLAKARKSAHQLALELAQEEVSGAGMSNSSENVCAVCSEPFAEGVVPLAISGVPGFERLHPECFVCSVDGETLNQGFQERNGQLYCEEHFREFFGPVCEACSTKIDSGGMQAAGKTWHDECFCCAYCSVPFRQRGGAEQDGQIRFYLHNGQFYCEKDYLEHMAQRCAGCDFPVKDGFAAMGAVWHTECFTCCECRQCIMHMEDQSFFNNHGRPICRADAEAQGLLQGLSATEREGTKTSPSRSGIFGNREKISAEERGACLSHGIAEAIRAVPPPPRVDGEAGGSLPLSAFKGRERWKFSIPSSGNPGRTLDFDFEAWAPAVFADLRGSAYGVLEEDYVRSISFAALSGGEQGEGKSGMLFFFSYDSRFIVKTVTPDEVPFFHTCLKSYHTHLAGPDAPRTDARHTASLLPRFLGLYAIKFNGEPPMHVVVMTNAFPAKVKLTEMYDLKGVLNKGRFVTPDQIEKGVKVLKDRNFMDRIQQKPLILSPEIKEMLAHQVQRDATFLQEHERMDYSLLLGVAPLETLEAAPGETWPTIEFGGAQTRSEDGKPGDEVVWLGIIDILQQYNWKKALEGSVKSTKHFFTHLTKKSVLANPDNAVSAASAAHYSERFVEFVIDGLA